MEWVNASMVQLKLLTQSRNKLGCCFAIPTAFKICWQSARRLAPLRRAPGSPPG